MSIYRFGCFSRSAIRLHRDYPNGCRAVRTGLLNPGYIASRLFLYCTFCIFPFLNFHYLIKISIHSSFPPESQKAMLPGTGTEHGATLCNVSVMPWPMEQLGAQRELQLSLWSYWSSSAFVCREKEAPGR